ncbi:MAG: hypothetical protein AAF941_09135 [Pseudomonadota bacterium]
MKYYHKGLEQVEPPMIGGTLPHDHYIHALHSIAKSLKRIADSLENPSNKTD